jgi:hypothetical protein
MFRTLGAGVVTLHRERLGGYVLPTDLGAGLFAVLDEAALRVMTGPDSL